MPGPSSSSIRAGSAFVEIFVKNNMLTRGLDAASKRLKSFGAFADGIFTKVGALGGLIATPILGALKVFTDTGSALKEMSDRLGASVEVVDALSFAAEQGGASVEDLETGLNRMQRAAVMAAGGSQEAADAFAKLGIDAKAFINLPLEEQVAAVADGLGSITNNAEKGAAAMDVLGRGGKKLLPMMAGGGAGVREKIAEAQRRGLVMSSAEADSADKLGKKFSALQSVLKRTFMSIGVALLPVFEHIHRVLEEKMRDAQAAQKWVKANSGLIVSALQVAKTLMKVAAGWFALRTALGHTGQLLGLVSAGFTMVASVLGMLLSPLGIVLATVGLLTAGLIALFPAGREWAGGLGDAFNSMKDRVLDTWGAIKAALAEGDLSLAARLAWLRVQAETLRIWKSLRLAWGDLTDHLADGWDSLIFLLETAWNAFGEFFEDVGKDAATSVMNAMAKAMEVLGEDMSEFREGIKLGRQMLDQQDAADRAKREKDLLAKLDAARDEREKAKEDVKAKLDKQIADLEAEIAAIRPKQGDPGFGIWAALQGIGLAMRGKGAGLQGAAEGMMALSSKGTFSGSAAGLAFGIGSDVQKDQLKTQKEIQKNTKRMADKLDDNDGLVFGA